MTNTNESRTAHLTSTLLGIRLVAGLLVGAAVALVASVWTIGAMAVARRAPAGAYQV